MMCQCRIILGKNCAILASDINHGRCYACVGAVGIQEIPVLPSQFCYKPKTALKKYFLKKKKKIWGKKRADRNSHVKDIIKGFYSCFGWDVRLSELQNYI